MEQEFYFPDRENKLGGTMDFMHSTDVPVKSRKY